MELDAFSQAGLACGGTEAACLPLFVACPDGITSDTASCADASVRHVLSVAVAESGPGDDMMDDDAKAREMRSLGSHSANGPSADSDAVVANSSDRSREREESSESSLPVTDDVD